MRIKSFRILNYKSFEDSGTHDLFAGFNVIVGQNNSREDGAAGGAEPDAGGFDAAQEF